MAVFLSKERRTVSDGKKGFTHGRKKKMTSHSLRGLKLPTKPDSYDFLHEFCCSFAKALNEVYGYPVHMLYNEKGELVHTYCVITQEENQLFVDVREMQGLKSAKSIGRIVNIWMKQRLLYPNTKIIIP